MRTKSHHSQYPTSSYRHNDKFHDHLNFYDEYDYYSSLAIDFVDILSRFVFFLLLFAIEIVVMALGLAWDVFMGFCDGMERFLEAKSTSQASETPSSVDEQSLLTSKSEDRNRYQKHGAVGSGFVDGLPSESSWEKESLLVRQRKVVPKKGEVNFRKENEEILCRLSRLGSLKGLGPGLEEERMTEASMFQTNQPTL
ncbi:hypothetical protein D9758_012851 [Tetrapyrgos nigripes]|uniref:Uncharacterized protein n=1 Tax=Tetrapyrgos nigripes TaxID=182062 RepID=A0A8H5CAP9_9AGAR|nr:hypothetical protein D9758_012851 [Tetrapyrgos nigripes]